MKQFFKNVKNIIININDSYSKACEKNKELSGIVTIGLSMVFVVVLVLAFSGNSNNTKQEETVTASAEVEITKNKGEEYFYLGEYDKAIKEYEKLSQDEEWPLYKIKMAEVCSAKGDYERANILIDDAYEIRNSLIQEDKDKYKKKDGELGNYITLISLFDGMDKNALEYGEIFLKDNPDNKELQRTMTAVYLSSGDKDKAKEIVEKYSPDEKSSYDLALYARMNMLVDKWDEGFEYLKKAWDLNKDEVKVFDIISQEASYDRDEIINKLTKLSEDNPKEISYKAWLVKCYSMSDKTMDKAESLFNEIKEEDLGKYVFNTVAAKIYQHKGLSAKAEELIKDLIGEESLIGYQTAAWYYYDKEDYDKAIEYCKKGILENEEYPDNYGFLMTDIMIKKGEPQLAEPYFTTALAKEPFNYNIMLKAADYYNYTIDNPQRAYEYYNLVSAAKPDNAEIYYNMAMSKLGSRESDKAKELINKCISLNGKNEKYHRTLGTIYLEEGNKEKAIEEIRAAHKINAKDILTLNNAGCYYISVENDIARGYENIKGAYDRMSDTTDEETKKYITKNYEKAKELLNKYNDDSDAKLEIPDLHLFY